MRWLIKPTAPKNYTEKFPEYSPLILQLLYNRDLKTQQTIDEFFNPDYGDDLHDPFLMKGVKEAVKRLQKAIEKKEKILVYGDYDADGIGGTVVLESTLKALGAKDISIYIPDRSREGYGLNQEAVEKISKDKVDLIVTVDCGISNFEEVKLAQSLGISVIITDHHLCPKKLPPTDIIVNPHQEDDEYPFKYLAGAGVAFKLSQALLRKKSDKVKTNPGFEKWLLDLVALATVADCMPLVGENRTLVKYGLVVLAQTKRVGLQELMKVAQINGYKLHIVENNKGEKEHKVEGLDSLTFAFALAPRVNVAARLADVNAAYRLLSTESQEEAQELAQKLEDLNRQRQQLVEKIVRRFETKLNKEELKKVILVEDKDLSNGLIGLVASKLCDRYCRPAFVFNIAKDGVRCSARSIPEFNVAEAIGKCSQYLLGYGGHSGAAGLSLKEKNLKDFKKAILKVAEKDISEEDLVPQLEIDTRLSLADFDWSTHEQVQKFSPFGNSNPEPRFLIENVEIIDLNTVGNNGRHIKMHLFGPAKNDQMKKVRAIGFGLGDWDEQLKLGDCVDVVGEFLTNEWNGNKELQFKILDLKKKVSI